MPHDDETRLAPPTPKPPSTGTSSGWLSSSGAIDHGRFEPGTILGGRYRIIGRLGRGGMGEVYRADDLKLGQPVALKFLPPDVDRDPARLTQLHTEVRMARQVSHPNVCRVYDIDEVDGHTFLSMEFVDGEDLASLLRRIGRFPQERGLEIARQVCAGLAAAHERGVVHRDFKPANVMLDGTGKVRITDFGLAGVAGESIRAGTPAYMAPEQLAGGEVTVQSDVYALGLVLYEIFTGQRAIDAKNVAELIHKREETAIVPPTAIVRDLDPRIEVAIMRCLQPDPAQRPATALAVAAAMPGGDPLAAALAAGETPSPEMVAAAGMTQALSARRAIAGIAWVIVSLAAITLCFQRVMMVNRVPLPKPPEALQDRAQEMLGRLGYDTSRAYAAGGFGTTLDYARFVAARGGQWELLAKGRPETVVYWYRTSPNPIVPLGNTSAVAGTNPPLTVSGMTLVVLDVSGRLAEFLAIPQPVDSGSPAAATNWQALFDAAGLQMSSFTPATPAWVPPMFADERMAWDGRLPEAPDDTVRIEAAAYKGRPVSFEITGPWSRSSRIAAPPLPLFNRAVQAFNGALLPALMIAGAVMAWQNLRARRGDRQGARVTALASLVLSLAAWVLGAAHFGDVGREVTRFFAATSDALFGAALLWLAYLGLEPSIRRFFPDSLIGWTRLISGQWRDPQVGRDLLIGIAAGLAMTVLYAVHNLVPPLLGRPEPMPFIGSPDVLLGLRHVLSSVLRTLASALQNGMLAVVGVVALLIVLKRRALTWVVACAIYVWAVISGMFPPGTPLLDTGIGLGIIAIFVGVILRSGLLAAIAALTTHFILLRAPLTTRFGIWYATAGITYTVVILGAAIAAVWLARQRAAAVRALSMPNAGMPNA
jgi:protein kinase-like protein